MPRKGKNKKIPKDFTLNDSTNAPKPLSRVKKSTATVPAKLPEIEIPWDQLPDDNDYDVVKKISPDGTMNLICIKKPKKKMESTTEFNDYPEIAWYHISKYILPQDIVNFSLINKTTYSITQQKSFWYRIYKEHCEGNPVLLDKLAIEEDCSNFGIKTRVIRCLFNTYPYFIKKITKMGEVDSNPREVLRYKCLNVWFHKGRGHWSIFFKFKRPQVEKKPAQMDVQDLNKIDVNPEIDCRVLQVNCQFFHEVPPLHGMTLTKTKVSLSNNLLANRVFLGFNSSPHVPKDVLPETYLDVDTVLSTMVIDWWHPNYPHFEIKFDWTEEDQRAIGRQLINLFAPDREHRKMNL